MSNQGLGINRDQNGFTLLEVIIGLVVAAISGVLLIAYAGTALTHSSLPTVRLQNSASLVQVMERMITYRAAHQQQELTDFQTIVENGNNTDSTPYFGSYDVTEQLNIKLVDGNPVVVSITIKKGDITLTNCFN